MEGFTAQEVAEATQACVMQQRLGCPTDREFDQMVSTPTVSRLNVSPSAVSNSHLIYGPNVENLKGRDTRQQTGRIDATYLNIPEKVYVRYRMVVLSADVMYVNEIPFLSTHLSGIGLFTAEHVTSRSADQLGKLLKKVICFYTRNRFKVQAAFMDQEFEAIAAHVPKL